MHLVRFYEGDASLLDAVTRFIGAGLGGGDAAVVIGTASHRADLERELAARGLDLERLRDNGRYVALDAAETLAQLLRDGMPDAARFEKVVGALVARLGDGGRKPVFAFGEMVALLWADGRRDAAIRLEELWNDLAGRQLLSLLCAYPIAGFAGEADSVPFLQVCGAHSSVIPAESYTGLATDDERLRAISDLQQKARVLEAEIGHRKEAEDTLRERNRAKDEFLAMLGHELRNPLSAVRSAVVSARLDPSRRERALDIAQRGVDQLGRLVDDLLDVARITQGRIAFRRERVAFATIVEHAVETARPLIDERSHALAVSLSGADVELDGDPTRLEQVIVNLITNAAKYTEPGGRIAVAAAYEGSEVVLRVRDNGMGIPPEMLPRVFDLFAQADRTLDRAQGGLGIGLTLVKRLVEQHGGRVEAHSDGPDLGAEFVVRLPAVRRPPREVAPAKAGDETRSACARVLIVEDNPDAAESLRMLLELLGHRVRVALDGPSGLEAARANPPDVMLVDIGLPGMDGYEVARRLRATTTSARAVLVALTGYGQDEDRRRALAAGFDYHLVKPVDPEALQGLVSTLGRSPALDPKRTTVH